MKRSLSFLLPALCASLLFGCVSAGNNFDDSKLTQIKKGETTEPDLVKLFGEPQNRSVNADGNVIITWMYMESRVKGTSFIPYAGAFMGGADSKSKTLTVTLTESKVTGYNYSGGGSEMRNMTQSTPKD